MLTFFKQALERLSGLSGQKRGKTTPENREYLLISHCGGGVQSPASRDDGGHSPEQKAQAEGQYMCGNRYRFQPPPSLWNTPQHPFHIAAHARIGIFQTSNLRFHVRTSPSQSKTPRAKPAQGESKNPRYHLNFPRAGDTLSSVTGSPAGAYCPIQPGARKPPSPNRAGNSHRPSPLWCARTWILLFHIAFVRSIIRRIRGIVKAFYSFDR